jgi:hypothetical protein
VPYLLRYPNSGLDSWAKPIRDNDTATGWYTYLGFALEWAV